MMPRRVSSSTLPVKDWPGHSVQEANAVLRRAFMKRDYLFEPLVPTRAELVTKLVRSVPRKSYGGAIQGPSGSTFHCPGMGGEDPYKLNQAVAKLNNWTD